jgi:hypothetical protein
VVAAVPHVFIENVSSDLFPAEAAKIRPLFLSDFNQVDGASSTPVLNPGSVLRTQEDLDRQTQANDDSNKIHLRFIGGNVDCTMPVLMRKHSTP